MDADLAEQRHPIPVFHSVLGVCQQSPKPFMVACAVSGQDFLHKRRKRLLLAL